MAEADQETTCGQGKVWGDQAIMPGEQNIDELRCREKRAAGTCDSRWEIRTGWGEQSISVGRIHFDEQVSNLSLSTFWTRIPSRLFFNP